MQNLERMRNFFQIYSKSSNELRNSESFRKSSNVLRISVDANITINLFPISWTHYLFLLSIENEVERQFYELEPYTCQWTLKEMERQFNS